MVVLTLSLQYPAPCAVLAHTHTPAQPLLGVHVLKPTMILGMAALVTEDLNMSETKDEESYP